MFGQITNKKGEKLYILTIANTNSIKPYTCVNTWEECLKHFEMATKELDNDRFFAQIIHKDISETANTAEASVRCNKKGCGNDYFSYITIEPLYTQAWE